MLQYNYVVFNSNDGTHLKKNPDGYYTICVKDLENDPRIHVVSQPLDYAPRFFRFLFALHHAHRINKIVKLPFKRLWFPFFFRHRFEKKLPLCFVILNPYIPEEYFKYLKKTYPDCKLVAVHRDLLSVWRDETPHFVQNPLFDLEMTFDEKEAANYGMEYFCEFESKLPLSPAADYPWSDVFFAGKAKDRLPRLMKIYHILTEAGLSCHYYLTGVPQELRIPYPGIEYADKPLTYRKMLEHTVNTRCVLEINQSNAVGLTSRFLEAVMYGKKLITDNLAIKESPFYDPRYIQCLSDVTEVSPSFVTEDVGKIDYRYNGEFSPLHLIEQIDAHWESEKSHG